MGNQPPGIIKDSMFYRFSLYGFLKNLRFFDPFIILIFSSYGLSFLQIGLLYSIRDIATNLLEIPTGILADSFGRRKAMIAAFVAYIASFMILYFIRDFWFLSLAMILFAFGEAARSGTHKALILEYLKINKISDLKIAYYGLTRSASQFGSAINALIAAGLVFYTGSYRIMFLASVIPYTLDLINLISYPKELDGEITYVKGDAVWINMKTTLKNFYQVMKNSGVQRILFNSASFTAVFKSSKDYLQPILSFLALSLVLNADLENIHKEALVIGVVYFVIYLLTSLASRQAYSVSNRFSSITKPVNLTYLLGAGLLLVSGVMVALEWEMLAVIGFIGLYLLNNIRRPISVGIISDQIQSNVMASGLSTESQLTTIFSALFAPLIGYLIDSLGLGNGISLMGLLMLFLYFFVRVQDPKKIPVRN